MDDVVNFKTGWFELYFWSFISGFSTEELFGSFYFYLASVPLSKQGPLFFQIY
jgi:hypothetical protein